VELLRLTPAGRADPRAREQLAADLAEVDAQLEDLQERRVTGEAASKSWTCSWPTRRSATPSWTTRVIAAERKLADAASSSARWSARRRRRVPAQRWQARRAELPRSIETAAQQVAAVQAGEQLQLELGA
jgi:chromosome segregation protein